jgi:DNA-binding NarL/FixJ family response regulator
MTPTPYFDQNGQFKGSFAVITDISKHQKEKQRLKEAHEELEKRVAERTFELEEKTRNLEDVNTALRVLLKKREEDKTILELRMLSNIRELVFPYIERIKDTHLSDRQQACIQIIDATLNDIVSPFLNRLSLDYRGLTSSEIQVANLVRHGSSSKEIADMLGLSFQTIEFYRKKIRKKLGITNASVNLRTFLNSLK